MPLPWQRVLKEVGMGALAIIAALIVLLPALWIVNLLFQVGLYTLLIVTILVGAALLLYQARLRSWLR